MQINSEYCVYVEGDDVVYGVQDLNDTSLFDEYSYYGAPQSPTFSGGYYFDNQEQSYEYGAYHYENYPVYYLYPTYPGYYALTNPQYGPENVYNAYYAYVPVNTWYYVPHFVYYLPTSTDNVNDVIYDVDATQSYESDVISSSMEQSFDNSQEFNWNLYNIENSSNEIVGEEQTTFQLVYEERPEMLNDASVDDEGKSECSNENLEKDIVANGAEMNECVDVGDQPYDIETNLCEDDVDLKLIKKISSMSIDDVKEDIDVNYENAKAFVYSEVLKGYTEIKNQLEELDWECHSLEDILEEEEPESDSSETDFNENVVEVLNNSNFLPDKEEEPTSVSLSRESEIASSKEILDKDYETLMEEAQQFVDLSVVEEKDKIDPFLKLSSSEEKLSAGSFNSIQEHHPPVDSSTVEETDKIVPLVGLALSKEELYSGSLNTNEDDCAPGNSSAIEEKGNTDSIPELSLREEKSDSGSRSSINEPDTKMSSQDGGEIRLNFDPDIVAPAASKANQRKKRFSGLRKFLARICCCAKKRS